MPFYFDSIMIIFLLSKKLCAIGKILQSDIIRCDFFFRLKKTTRKHIRKMIALGSSCFSLEMEEILPHLLILDMSPSVRKEGKGT